MMDLEEKIREKENEIANYIRILKEYNRVRWANYGRRRLVELEIELEKLKNMRKLQDDSTKSLPEGS